MFAIFLASLIMIMVFPVAKCNEVTNEGCWAGHLQAADEMSPPLKLTEAVTLKILPEKQVKVLRLRLLLENKDGLQLYSLGLDADIGVHWGDVDVTMMDVNSEKNIFKVSWPPILLPRMWTTMYIRLPYQYLFQLSVIPKEQHEVPRNSMSPPVILTPLAASVRLAHSGVTRLTLQLLTATSIQYRVNCDKDYLATSFASEFGIASSAPVWKLWTWILIGLLILQLVIIIILAMKFYTKNKKWSPTSFVRAHFRQPGSSNGKGPSHVSSKKLRGRNSSTQNTDTLQPPNVSLGTVSSRAPSPGQEIDETTFDYINQAYTNA